MQPPPHVEQQPPLVRNVTRHQIDRRRAAEPDIVRRARWIRRPKVHSCDDGRSGFEHGNLGWRVKSERGVTLGSELARGNLARRFAHSEELQCRINVRAKLGRHDALDSFDCPSARLAPNGDAFGVRADVDVLNLVRRDRKESLWRGWRLAVEAWPLPRKSQSEK